MNLFIKLIVLFAFTGCIQKNIQETYSKNLKNSSERTQTISSEKITEDNLQSYVIKLIINSPFSLIQKKQICDLQSELNEKLQINATINLKLRALLFEELLSANFDSKNIDVLATMLERNINESNFLLFDAIQITNMITGRGEPSNVIEDSPIEMYMLY